MPKKIFKEDEEIIIDEDIKPANIPAAASDSEDDSEDEAPEAFSSSSAKEAALMEEKARRAAAAHLAQREKEKRRRRDQLLKEQKQNSKRQRKEENERKRKRQEEEENAKDDDERDEQQQSDTDDKVADDDSQNRLLPLDLLVEASKENEATKKRVHLTAADFERLAAEEAEAEAKEKERKRKQRIAKEGRQVGEYTVKVLNHRPRAEKVERKFQSFRDHILERQAVPRRAAIMVASEAQKGRAGFKFRRSN